MQWPFVKNFLVCSTDDEKQPQTAALLIYENFTFDSDILPSPLKIHIQNSNQQQYYSRMVVAFSGWIAKRQCLKCHWNFDFHWNISRKKNPIQCELEIELKNEHSFPNVHTWPSFLSLHVLYVSTHPRANQMFLCWGKTEICTPKKNVNKNNVHRITSTLKELSWRAELLLLLYCIEYGAFGQSCQYGGNSFENLSICWSINGIILMLKQEHERERGEEAYQFPLHLHTAGISNEMCLLLAHIAALADMCESNGSKWIACRNNITIRTFHSYENKSKFWISFRLCLLI